MVAVSISSHLHCYLAFADFTRGFYKCKETEVANGNCTVIPPKYNTTFEEVSMIGYNLLLAD